MQRGKVLPWLSLAWHSPILLQCLGLCYDMCEEDIHIGIVSLRGHFPAFNIKCQWSTIIFSEPIGFSAPKFSSESKNLGDFSIEHLSSYNLNCPAQSSPAPSFRLVTNLLYEGLWLLDDTTTTALGYSPHSHNKSAVSIRFWILEPIGTSAPKFSTNSDTLGSFKSALGSSFNFVCPAQSSPTPSFRWGSETFYPFQLVWWVFFMI